VRPFRVDVPDAALDDLRSRLARTRWPSQPAGASWERGVPVEELEALAEYWRTAYDWRAAEAEINRFPQYITEIDGADVHFVHARSPEPDALPLLMTHGWPGSVAEFLDVIGPLTDPRAHGGDPADAFHVVAPTPPGFGFSGPTRTAGWTVGRIASAWAELMRRLGYRRYAAHGTDLGVWISLTLAGLAPDELVGAHVNYLLTPDTGGVELDAADRQRLALMDAMAEKAAYMAIQSTRPQTLAYGLTDSPAAQLAWVAEKFREWTDHSGPRPWGTVGRDRLLTNVSIYWLTATAGSAAQLYFEMAEQLPAPGRAPVAPPPLHVPLAVAVHPHDLTLPVRALAERRFPRIVGWTEFDRGGHFPAMEEPDLFVADVRAFARALPDDRAAAA
jgi:epoxide hydrolase